MRIRARLPALAPLVLLLAAASVAPALAGLPDAPSLTVVATDPAPPRATLGPGAAFYIRYRVATATPVAVQIEAYYQGGRLSTGTSGMARIPAGGGTDAAFFFLLSRKRQAVDEIRLLVSDARQSQRRWTFAVPVALTFDPAITGAPPPVAAWVKTWQQHREAEMQTERRAEARRAAKHPGADVGLRILIGLLVLGLPVASLVLPLWAIRRWEGRWRLLAGLSVGVVALKLASVIVGLARDPTSHNLWPLEIALWEIPALGFLAVLWIARRLTLRSNASGPGA